MEYRFIDSGEGDLRAQRTRTSLKETYIRMAGEEDTYRKINVTELTGRSDVGRKTFYLHYSSMDEMLTQIAEDIVRTLDTRFNGDLEHDILVIYRFYDSADAGLAMMLFAPEYSDFQRHLYSGLFTRGAFGAWSDKAREPELVRGYFYSVVGIYRSYIDSQSGRRDLSVLARNAANMLYCGISRGGRAKACRLLLQIYMLQRTSQSILRRPVSRYSMGIPGLLH